MTQQPPQPHESLFRAHRDAALAWLNSAWLAGFLLRATWPDLGLMAHIGGPVLVVSFAVFCLVAAIQAVRAYKPRGNAP